MAFSLEPSDIVTAGAEPWTDAALAAAAFVGLVIVTGVSLRLWHTRQWRPFALAATAVEIGCVGWACMAVYREYF